MCRGCRRTSRSCRWRSSCVVSGSGELSAPAPRPALRWPAARAAAAAAAPARRPRDSASSRRARTQLPAASGARRHVPVGMAGARSIDCLPPTPTPHPPPARARRPGTSARR
jgi:hypothetical protein